MTVEVCRETECRRVVVTPQMAREWLERNKNNRTLNRSRVALFREMIEDGSFLVTHQGIAFYYDGDLADGQHRLTAIADGTRSVELMVTWGLPREAGHAIDRGRSRSITNVLNLMGVSLTQHESAACRALWNEYHAARTETSWRGQAIDTGAFVVFCEHVAEAVRFAMPPKQCRGLSHASVTAAIASAWFTQSRVDLLRFKELLHGGVGASANESAAIKLRDYLLISTVTGGGTESRQELYLRACTAIRAFLEGRGLSKLYCRPDARFPIPPCGGLT